MDTEQGRELTPDQLRALEKFRNFTLTVYGHLFEEYDSIMVPIMLQHKVIGYGILTQGLYGVLPTALRYTAMWPEKAGLTLLEIIHWFNWTECSVSPNEAAYIYTRSLNFVMTAPGSMEPEIRNRH